MSHNVLIQRAVGAKNVAIWNRSAVHATVDFDNGNLVSLDGFSATDGEGEVFAAAVPATATLGELWMVYNEDTNVTVDGTKKFKGINTDPQDFYVPALEILRVFKPQVGDIITVTADGLAGTQSTNEFVVAANASQKLNWASAAISGLSYKLLAEEQISIPNGGINSGRVAAFRFECVATA